MVACGNGYRLAPECRQQPVQQFHVLWHGGETCWRACQEPVGGHADNVLGNDGFVAIRPCESPNRHQGRGEISDGDWVTGGSGELR